MTLESQNGRETSWRDYGESPLTPLRQSILTCFVQNGYHGSTTRMIASAVGMSVPGLYHHYDSKQSMLVELMEQAMADLYARSLAALEEGDSCIEKLDLLVECLVLFHAHRGELAFIAANEIRALDPEARERHIAARDRQQRLLDDIIEEGAKAGTFSSEHPHDTSRAITTMCTGVAQWFRPDGPRSAESVAELYIDLTERMLGVGR